MWELPIKRPVNEAALLRAAPRRIIKPFDAARFESTLLGLLMLLRQKIAFYLEDIETPTGRAVNLVMAGLVLLSSAIFVTETYAIPNPLRTKLNALDVGILVIFAIEYLLRFW